MICESWLAMSNRFVTVSPFDIAIDTREQKRWMFNNIPGNKGQGTILVKYEWISLGQSNGDYSIRGFHIAGKPRISIERKSLSDLYSTILSERTRFVRELEQLNSMEYAAVIVEAPMEKVLTYCPKYWKDNNISVESQLSKRRSVMGSIYAWQLRYPTVRWWFVSRRYCPILCYRLLSVFFEENKQ